jgi:hypothetical protein
MPKTHRPSSSSAEAPSKDPLVLVRDLADALYRGAVECCRQHDRAAKASSVEVPGLEHKHLDELCKLCDGSLVELAEAYKAAAGAAPQDGDAAWWHKANLLWHASREFARRHAGCESLSKRIASKHDAEQLGSVQMEYELEASSLLALRHASEAYRKTRPELV